MSRSRRLCPVNIQEREKIAKQKHIELKNTDKNEKKSVEKKKINFKPPQQTKPSQQTKPPQKINVQATILNTCSNLRGTCKNIRELANNVESLLGSVESFVPVLSSLVSSYTKNLISASKEKAEYKDPAQESIKKEYQAPIPEPPSPEKEPVKKAGMRGTESSLKIPSEKELQQFLNNPLVKSAVQLLSQQLSKKNS